MSEHHPTVNTTICIMRMTDGKYYVFPGGEQAAFFAGRECVVDDFGNLVPVR